MSGRKYLVKIFNKNFAEAVNNKASGPAIIDATVTAEEISDPTESQAQLKAFTKNPLV